MRVARTLVADHHRHRERQVYSRFYLARELIMFDYSGRRYGVRYIDRKPRRRDHMMAHTHPMHSYRPHLMASTPVHHMARPEAMRDIAMAARRSRAGANEDAALTP